MDPRKTIKNLVFSFIRTAVPNFVAWLAGWLTDGFGFVLDESTKMQLVMLFTAIVAGVYYLVVRLLETYVAPKFSWFLGDFRKGLTAPVYASAVEKTEIPVSTNLNPS